jgi:hypothetical protein
MADKKPDKDWPDLSVKAGMLDEAPELVNIFMLSKSLHLHAEIIEESTDKICKALWALVSTIKKEVKP